MEVGVDFMPATEIAETLNGNSIPVRSAPSRVKTGYHEMAQFDNS
jgi:hypothetical protein